jgi:D-sedoheptulose 7-phosphate isomerase
MLEQRIQQQFFDSADLKYAAAEVLSKPIADAVSALVGCITGGGKVLACGNGGSAADAQHFAAEFVGRFERERPGLAALALTVDTSILTAVGNDYGYEHVFSKQVAALGSPGDVLLAMSTSGNSANVLAAVDAAHGREMTVVALTGNTGGRMRELLTEDRCPHLRPARADGAHPGGAPAGAALPVRCGRPATARRTGKHMTLISRRGSRRGLSLVVAGAALSGALLSGCGAILVGGAIVGGAMVATDRRTTGAQVDDETIEVKSSARMSETFGDRVRIDTTSYNRMALLTGEVPNQADKTTAEQIVARVPNVSSVVKRADHRAAQHLHRALQGHLRHHQGEGQPGGCERPVRQLDQGHDPPRRRLPDGSRHRARGHSRLGGYARRQRRGQGGPGVRAHLRGGAGEHPAQDAGAGRPRRQRRRRPAVAAQSRRLIRLEVSARLPPRA